MALYVVLIWRTAVHCNLSSTRRKPRTPRKNWQEGHPTRDEFMLGKFHRILRVSCVTIDTVGYEVK